MGGASAKLGAASGPSVLTFTDPAGDSAGAPDITKVTITGDPAAGTIAFSLTATGLKPASTDGLHRFVDVWLNTDRNRSTGSSGDEYHVYVWTDGSNPGFWYSIDRWTGSTWQTVPYSPTISATSTGDTYTVKLSAADLGGNKTFALDVQSQTYDPNANKAIARDDATPSFSWVYDIAGPTSTIYAFVRPVIGKPIVAPAQLRAGKRVTVSFPVSSTGLTKNGPLTRGTMVCDPSVSGKVVPMPSRSRTGSPDSRSWYRRRQRGSN